VSEGGVVVDGVHARDAGGRRGDDERRAKWMVDETMVGVARDEDTVHSARGEEGVLVRWGSPWCSRRSWFSTTGEWRICRP